MVYICGGVPWTDEEWKKKKKKSEAPMKIVPIEKIPLAEDIKDAPVKGRERLLAVYKRCRLMEKICEEKEGIGISAVQVGIPWNLFIIKTKGKFEHFVNCTYEPVGDDKITSIEGCLSLLNEDGDFRRFEMTRSLIVKVTGKKLIKDDGLTLEDFSAYIHAEDQGVVFQHEIEHQKGVAGLISNQGKEVFIW